MGAVAGRRAAPTIGLTLAGLWAFVASGLPAIASLAVGISTIDLSYQIRAGELMARTGTLLRSDPFTFTARGSPWLNQQWGAQLVFFAVFGAGSWLGLALLRAGLIGGTLALLYRVFRRRGLGSREAAILCVAVFAVGTPGLGLRPQSFGLLLFALSTWILDRRSEDPRRLFLIPPVLALWANLHGSFPLGLALVGIALLEDLRGRAPGWRRTLAALIASCLATLANPWGPGVWRYAVTVPTDPQVARSILEWQPPTVRTVPGAILFVSFSLVVLLLARRGTRLAWPSLLRLAIFAGVALVAIRGMVWWAVGASPVVADLLRPEGPAPERPGGDVDARRSALNVGIAASLLVLAVILGARWTGRPPLGGLLWHAPVTLTRALEEAVAPGSRVFNAQVWGSWLEFAAPAYAPAVDARIELFPARVWREYYDVSTGRDGWQRILDRWEVAAVLASREQQATLIPLLRRDPAWRLILQDDEGALFVRVEGGSRAG